MSLLKKIPCFVIHGVADTEREPLIARIEGAIGKRLKVVQPEDGEAILAGGFPTRHPVETEPTAADVIGLTATYIKILEKCLEEDYEMCAIFEDDTEVIGNCEQFLTEVPENWDMIFFGMDKVVQAMKTQAFYQVRRAFGVRGIVFKKKAMQDVVKAYKQSITNNYALPIDWVLSGSTKVNSLVVFAPLDNLIEEAAALR